MGRNGRLLELLRKVGAPAEEEICVEIEAAEDKPAKRSRKKSSGKTRRKKK